MYRSMGKVSLKTGETVEMGVVRGPDLDWAERIEKLLAHKGEIWNWQNSSVLREEVGLEAYFHVLHRGGEPLANIMTVELAGVGVFGHVWTRPEDRRKGAAGSIMERQMADFRRRGGKALFLGTGWESTAYWIYHRNGFRSIEDRSGYMDYYAASWAEFESAYFAAGPAEIEELDWPHWPASAALFMGGFGGMVRCAPLKLFGRASTEGPLLGPIRAERAWRQQAEPGKPAALVLVNKATTAVVGLAVRAADPTWPGKCLLDVYCHPAWWSAAGELLAGVAPGTPGECVAYADTTCPQKHEVLQAAGFQPAAVLKRWLPADKAATGFVDVTVYERQG